MALIIPGYEMFFDGAVYYRDETGTTKDEEKVLFRELLLLRRYVEPTMNDLLEYLQNNLESFVKLFEDEIDYNEKVMQRIINRIINGESETMEAIKKKVQLSLREEQTSWINLKFGAFPIGFFEDNQKAGNMKNPQWFYEVFSHKSLVKRGFGEIINLQFRLEDGIPFDRSDMDVLIKRGNYGSDYLVVSREEKSIRGYDPVFINKKLLNPVYAALTSPREVAQLENFTEQLYKNCLTTPLKFLYVVEDGRMAQEKKEKEEQLVEVPGFTIGLFGNKKPGDA